MARSGFRWKLGERIALIAGVVAAKFADIDGIGLPVFWTGVADDGTFMHREAVQVPVGFESRLTSQRAKNVAHPAVQAVLKESLAERFVSWWALRPIAEVYCLSSVYRVERTDVRFSSPWLDSSGFRLAWEVEHRAATEQYAVLSHRWLRQWNEDTLLDGDCAFRMEVEMSRSSGTTAFEK